MAGIDKVKGSMQAVELELGGKTRRLVYDMNAFGVLEQKFGNVEVAMDSMSEGKIGDIKVLLWAGLIHDEVKGFDEDTGEPTGYNITPYQVGQWISSPAMLQDLMAAMAQAIQVSMPAPEESVEGKLEN